MIWWCIMKIPILDSIPGHLGLALGFPWRIWIIISATKQQAQVERLNVRDKFEDTFKILQVIHSGMFQQLSIMTTSQFENGHRCPTGNCFIVGTLGIAGADSIGQFQWRRGQGPSFFFFRGPDLRISSYIVEDGCRFGTIHQTIYK